MDNLNHAIYINLEERTDRKEHFLREIEKLDIPHLQVERMNAVKNENGALGCSMSHLKCIQYAKEQNWDSVMVLEDDITFLNPEIFLNQLFDFFINKKKESWDVLLLAGNNMHPYKKINSGCIQVMNCITTTGYIVQKHYYDKLIHNYKEGILKLLREPDMKKKFAIDKYWLLLQQEDRWFLLTPLSVVQYENYSDIEGKETNFQDYMLNYDKIMVNR